MKLGQFLPVIFLCSEMLLRAQSSTSSKLVRFESRERQTSLLELYTSEGCSNCPPAEAWLNNLCKSPVLWRDFVPAAFHVDYWDSLRWRDRWAKKEYSERQRGYAKLWRRNSVYTPGFVLNGSEWRDWSGSKDLPPAPPASPGVLRVTSADAIRWRVDFSPADQPKGAYAVHGALLGNELTSEIKAGENRRQRLTHNFVVLVTSDESLTNNSGVLEGEFVLTRNPKQTSGRLALAVWLTSKGKLEPIQATGGWLGSQRGK